MSGSQQLLLGGAPTVTPVDPYFYSVTSLLHGDGTNGGQNNTFLDSSSNNFTITRNGNTTQGSFSPFSQTGWSNYFDGSGDYLSMSDAGLAIGNGDFTLECWVYCTTTPSDKSIFEGRSGGTGTTGFTLTAFTGTTVRIFSGSALITSGTINYVNTWCHIAVSRVSGTTTLYVNGISQGTTTSLGNLTDSSFLIGAGKYASPPTVDAFFTGYISNFRIVKGTAVYTANFTPPTAPLTAITNTSLLTCQSNRFRDASTNNFTITANGDVSVQPFSPFNPTTAYSTGSIGGSGYFDGSGDLLTVSSANQIFPSGTQNFSVEFYTYFVSAPSLYPIFLESKEATNGFQIVYTNDGGANQNKLGIGVYGVGLITSATFNTYFRQWVHIVATRNGNDFRLFFNGTLVAYASNSQSFVTVGTQTIGAQASGLYPTNAYITNIRTCLGAIPTDYQTSSTTTGTQIFTPPSAPVTTTSQGASSVAFLANFTNGAIFDNAAVADYETVGNAQISTSVKKYGTGSLAFDGAGDYLSSRITPNAVFGSGDMTFECWVYPNTISGIDTIYDTRTSGSFGNESFLVQLNDGVVQVWAGSYSSSFPVIASGGAVAASTWTFIAFSRTAGVNKLFINGTQVASNSISWTQTIVSTNPYYIGQTVGVDRPFDGYIDDLRISKGISRYPYSFTPPTAAFPNIGGPFPTLTADPYYEYTTLLLPGNGTNGAQNNTFLDSSTNAFTITRNGNTTQGTFSPFSQTGWGNYFDGSGDYLTSPNNAAIQLDNSTAFTLECWFNAVAFANQNIFRRIAGSAPFAGYGLATGEGGAATNTLVFWDGSTWRTVLAGLVAGQWYHFAATYEGSGTTLRFFVNGTQQGSALTCPAGISNTADTFAIGAANAGTAPFTGYVSNLRIVKGTAVYTANFTPPTTPLTAIANTSLLTCQSNRFIDNSSNNFAITRNGDVSVQAFSPFNPTASWSAATYGGSGYFDGSGDYLSIPNSTSLQLGSSDWDIECWVYLNSTSGIQRPISQADSNYEFAFYISSGALTAYSFQSGGTQNFAISMGTLTSGQWYHIAATRSGSNIRAFVNGAQVGTATFSGTIDARTGGWRVGASYTTSDYLNGYVTDARIVKGSAVYTAAFTPPTAPLTAITNTQLLCNFTNAGIYDATSKNDLETVGNAQISTTQSKFGGSSMLFDGTGDYLLLVNSENFAMRTGDWTVEGWIYPTAVTTNNRFFIDTRSAGGTGGIGLYLTQTNANLTFTDGTNSISGGAVSLNAWSHVAVVRYGSTVTLYLNGFATGTALTSYSGNLTSNRCFVGTGFDLVSTIFYTGNLQDLRITKGIARYTRNFTPPTTAFLTL